MNTFLHASREKEGEKEMRGIFLRAHWAHGESSRCSSFLTTQAAFRPKRDACLANRISLRLRRDILEK